MPQKETNKRAVHFGPFTDGLVDTPDRQDLSARSLYDGTVGFRIDRMGVARAEYGSDTYTAAEIRAGKRGKSPIQYPAPDGETYLCEVIDGGLYKESTAGSGTLDDLISCVDPGGTATRTGNDVAFESADNLDKTVKVGDHFWYTNDGPDVAGTVDIVLADTLNVLGYGGTDTSGGFKIRRPIAANSWLAIGDERLWITDGAGPLEWYGETSRESGIYVYRDAGLPRPTTAPTIALAAGGRLSAGDYRWGLALEDARGIISDVIYTGWVTAEADQKATLAALDSAPAWATKYRFYRNREGGTKLYHIVQDTEWLRLSAIAEAGGSSTLTCDSEARALTADAHIHRYVEFRATGTKYKVLDNSGTNVSVLGDASAESTIDDFQIAGGFDIGCTSIVDVSADIASTADTGLDLNDPAPGEAVDGFRDHAQPPSGLSQITFFRQGNGWAAKEGESRIRFSGMSQQADRPLGTAASGDGELEYAPHYHDVGSGDNKPVKRLFAIVTRLFVAREDGIWELWNELPERTAWRWEGRSRGRGLLAPRSLAVFKGTAFFLGTEAGQTDIMAFDGWEVRSVGLDRIEKTLKGMKQLSEAVGVIFRGEYWLSYMTAATGGQDKTLRYYVERHIFDKQPWGCGEFCLPFESGDEHYLLCCAPDLSDGTQVGHIRRAYGTTYDHLGAAVTRTLITGDVAAVPTLLPVDWQLLHTDTRGA